MLGHRDVVAEAVTGSGKTLAFAVAAVELLAKLDRRNVLRCVVVSPTRELATQTLSVMAKLCKFHGIAIAGATGGSDKRKVDHAEILVGTPGRLEETLLDSSSRNVEFLVLDEADTLLDLGFSDVVHRIISKLPKQRRTALFSATQSRGVDDLAKVGLRNPATVRVRIGGKKTTETPSLPAELRNGYVLVDKTTRCAKLDATLRLIDDLEAKKVLVFFDNGAAVEFFARAAASIFQAQGLDLVGLAGKMTQKRRTLTWTAFQRSQEKKCLFATDVAARGLDADDVDLVIQFDPPKNVDTFIHRVGRTARAGKSGTAIVLLEDHEDAYVEFLKLRGIHLTSMDLLPKTTKEYQLLDTLRGAASKDRAILELGTRAFTSHVRAYREHQLKFIFRWDEKDIIATALAYGILRLPKMPELARARKLGRLDDSNFPRFETKDVAFADPVREKARQKRLLEPLLPKKKKTKKAGGVSVDKKDDDSSKQKKQQKKKKKKRGRHAQIIDEWDDLAQDERLAKKLRTKKISQDDFDTAFLEEAPADDDKDDDDTLLTDYQRTKNLRRQRDVQQKRSASYRKKRKLLKSS